MTEQNFVQESLPVCLIGIDVASCPSMSNSGCFGAASYLWSHYSLSLDGNNLPSLEDIREARRRVCQERCGHQLELMADRIFDLDADF